MESAFLPSRPIGIRVERICTKQKAPEGRGRKRADEPHVKEAIFRRNGVCDELLSKLSRCIANLFWKVIPSVEDRQVAIMRSNQRHTRDSSYTRFSPSVIGVSRSIFFFSTSSIRACFLHRTPCLVIFVCISVSGSACSSVR